MWGYGAGFVTTSKMQINIKDYNITRHISYISSSCIDSLLYDYYVLIKMIHFCLKGKDIHFIFD